MAGPRRPAPRPKRRAEEFARSHYLDDDGSASKKPRFDVRNPSALAPDAPEQDSVLESDEIGKRGQQTKRNAVNIDGYESDSSNEGFDARAEVKAKKTEEASGNGSTSKLEDEDDMFADLEEEVRNADDDDETSAGASKKKEKTVRFLDVDEIDGQEDESTSGGRIRADFSLYTGPANGKVIDERDKDSSSDSDIDEAERADPMGQVDEEIGAGGKKEHAPKIDAFNMKSEQEEGRFDAHGNFVRKATDPDTVHDSWLEGVSKKDMKKAREAAEKRDQERRQKIIEDDAVLTGDVLKTLIPYLDRGETVLEALARLGRGKEKKKPKWQNKNKRKRSAEEGMDLDTDKPEENPAETRRREAVEGITGAADQLLGRGQTEIYEAQKEALIRQYGRETGEQWVDPPIAETENDKSQPMQWEYRWFDERDGGEAHGPYDGSMMVSWKNAGYFGDGVEFRRVGQGGDWSLSADFK